MPKKIPMRMCVGCRRMYPKRELVRVVCSPEGVISMDLKGKVSGRGAYVCKNMECLKKAVKIKALDRAFDKKLPPELIDTLTEELLRAE